MIEMRQMRGIDQAFRKESQSTLSTQVCPSKNRSLSIIRGGRNPISRFSSDLHSDQLCERLRDAFQCLFGHHSRVQEARLPARQQSGSQASAGTTSRSRVSQRLRRVWTSKRPTKQSLRASDNGLRALTRLQRLCDKPSTKP